MSPLYRALRSMLRLALELFYVEIRAVGLEHVPARGPVVFASNHPNSVMDSFVLGSQTKRAVSFLARSGLFSNPIVRRVLLAAGVIPVYRRSDGEAGSTEGNEEAFRAAFDVLERGGALGIFPEGQNAPERHVREIKTGVARIALGAEARSETPLGVKVIPVGLNFEDRDRFLTRVLVRFGEPIEAQSYRGAYAADPVAAARELTEKVQAGIRKAAVHVADLRHEALVQQVYDLYGGVLHEELGAGLEEKLRPRRWRDRLRGLEVGGDDLDTRFAIKQGIADAIDYFERERPDTLARLRRRIDAHQAQLAEARLRLDLRTEDAWWRGSKYREVVLITLYAFALAPVALFGVVHNVVPFLLTDRIASRVPDEPIRAVTALIAGMGLYGVTYGAIVTLVYLATGSWLAALLYFLAMPIAGFWALRYRRQLARSSDRLIARTLFSSHRALVRRLMLEREQLLMEIDSLRADLPAEPIAPTMRPPAP